MASIMEELLAKSIPESTTDDDKLLVSIISFCKDRAPIIRRSIDSVLGQSYRNLEFVVQDGASTDGTLDILKNYRDQRIKVVSEKDSGPAEAFWKVLNRCQGEIIGTCLSDEELLPGAIQRAVEFFRANPEVGAMTCDGYVTDIEGNIVNEFNAGEFSFVDYLFGWYCPFWPGSFFRRQALIEIGLHRHRWTIECLEFEIWCRLATQHVVRHVPVRMSKYAVHQTQLSNTKEYFHEHFDNRAKVIGKMFSEAGFFGADEVKLKGCLYNQLYLLYNHVKAYKLVDQTNLLAQRLRALVGSITFSEKVRCIEYFNMVDGNLPKFTRADTLTIFRQANQIWVKVALCFSSDFRKRLPQRFKDKLRHYFTVAIYVGYTTKHRPLAIIKQLLTRLGGEQTRKIYSPEFAPKLYHDVAQIYYARGQIDEASQAWRRAEVMEDPAIDGVAAQAMLMSSTATYADLARTQRRWAERHAKPIRKLGECPIPPYHGDRKIRVGYFCAWFESDTFRSILGQVIQLADRDKFEIYGYSSSPVSREMQALFDRFSVTGGLSDADFVRQVRNDRIDICVEVTGFSPFNRFAAMASRCAPIQISYLNHTGTSAVPNVDYVLADKVSVPPEHDQYFTEKVWRLPGCFLSYSYESNRMPDVVPPPCLERGFVTFGCFGSGGKINTRLIGLWAKLMRRVLGSRFYVRNHQLSALDNRSFMESQFRRVGVDPERLTILGGADRQTILRCYDEIDISLDTWPYCGGNTIAESLWQGVPLVTLKTDRFSGRYGASLLLAAGCGELVAETPEEYVEIAAALASSPERLRGYRSRLRSMAQERGMSDPAAFARKLDAAYVGMMQRLHGLHS
jgi:predicted O-linked N-acetylglucosamine transferase (SPINDLY family)/glycosyltransferase involved in cell wall biosynthesis